MTIAIAGCFSKRQGGWLGEHYSAGRHHYILCVGAKAKGSFTENLVTNRKITDLTPDGFNYSCKPSACYWMLGFCQANE